MVKLDKYIILAGSLALLTIPILAHAQEAIAPVQSGLQNFYEKTVGPIGALAGFVGIIAVWLLSKKVEPTFGLILKTFAVVMLLVNAGSITYALVGVNMMSDEISRYIERTVRLAGLLLYDVAALLLFLKINKIKKQKNLIN